MIAYELTLKERWRMSFNLPASQATTFRKLGCPLSIFILIGVNQGKYSCKIVIFF